MSKAERTYPLVQMVQDFGYPPGFFGPKFLLEGTKRSVPIKSGSRL